MRRALLLLPLLFGACRCGKDQDPSMATVAECVLADGDVRFHPPRDVVWQSVGLGHRFAQGDWVRTAEAARARIRFDGGSLVEMDPASTLIIETLDHTDDDSLGPLIALESGSLRGTAEKGVSGRVSLRTPGGERVSLAPQRAGETFDYRVSVRSSGDVELAVTAGEAEVVTKDSKSVLRAGEAKLMSRGRLSETERLLVAPALLAPAEDAVLTLERDESVGFSWAQVPGARRYRLEHSRDPAFQAEVERVEVDGAEWSGRLTPGDRHWRVTAESASGLLGASSPVRRFELREQLVLEHLVAPPNGVELESSGRRIKVEFVWNPLEGASGYELVVSRNKDLSRPVLSQPLGETRFATDTLAPGRYHWGVFAAGESKTPLFREPFRFALRRGAQDLEAPKKLQWR